METPVWAGWGLVNGVDTYIFVNGGRNSIATIVQQGAGVGNVIF